uniref:Uncharacterized protein n=1 Tax=Rhizophora mucronata TaxID=61149 RepID=A0A2P2KZ06_RHIMU
MKTCTHSMVFKIQSKSTKHRPNVYINTPTRIHTYILTYLSPWPYFCIYSR